MRRSSYGSLQVVMSDGHKLLLLNIIEANLFPDVKVRYHLHERNPGLTLFGLQNPQSYGIVLTKNSPLSEIFSTTLLKLQEEGVINKIIKDYQHLSINQQSNNQLDGNEMEEISIEQAITPLIFMAASLSFVIVIAMIERIVWNLSRGHQ